MIIFAHRQTIKQRILNSITEPHSNPLWSVDSRGAGQFMPLTTRQNFICVVDLTPSTPRLCLYTSDTKPIFIINILCPGAFYHVNNVSLSSKMNIVPSGK